MKKYYKVDLYSVDLEKEKQLQNEYEKGNNMSLILKCCSKRKVGSVIVYRTNIFKDKYREMITKMEIPGLIYSFWNGIYMTKNFPLFFESKIVSLSIKDFSMLLSINCFTKFSIQSLPLKNNNKKT